MREKVIFLKSSHVLVRFTDRESLVYGERDEKKKRMRLPAGMVRLASHNIIDRAHHTHRYAMYANVDYLQMLDYLQRCHLCR